MMLDEKMAAAIPNTPATNDNNSKRFEILSLTHYSTPTIVVVPIWGDKARR